MDSVLSWHVKWSAKPCQTKGFKTKQHVTTMLIGAADVPHLIKFVQILDATSYHQKCGVVKLIRPSNTGIHWVSLRV